MIGYPIRDISNIGYPKKFGSDTDIRFVLTLFYTLFFIFIFLQRYNYDILFLVFNTETERVCLVVVSQLLLLPFRLIN